MDGIAWGYLFEPCKINEYLFEDRDEKSLLRVMEQANADIMSFGHMHKPYRPWEFKNGMVFR